jgi:uncharacterized protein (DUF697 family)
MHDLDRTTAEFESDHELFESDGELEFGETFETFQETDHESVLNEADEMQLAAELLEVTDETELDQFLGGLFKKVAGGVRSFARSGIGRALGGALKKVGKVALPIAGKAVGGFFGGPAGAAIGGKLGSMATKLFELELEGMSYEDQEFEVARRFVRLAADSAKNAMRAPASMSPQAAAQTALKAAARKHAPGLVKGTALTGYPSGTGRTGRWFRRGRKVVLLGV